MEQDNNRWPEEQVLQASCDGTVCLRKLLCRRPKGVQHRLYTAEMGQPGMHQKQLRE
jgi:hypothetical protein